MRCVEIHLTDTGFFDAERLRREDEQGVCWITRIPSGTLLEIDDVRQSIGTFLSTCTESRIDVPAFLCGNRLPIRFVALRGPTSVVRQRLERQQKEAGRQGRTVSRERRDLCRWTVFATNIPSSLYTADEMYTLYRVRWQIELVFKLWKSEGGVAVGHGRTGDCCLCEFLAKKVLGQMITNWLIL